MGLFKKIVSGTAIAAGVTAGIAAGAAAAKAIKDTIDTASETANDLVNNVKDTLDPSVLLPVSQLPNIIQGTLNPLMQLPTPELTDITSGVPVIPEGVTQPLSDLVNPVPLDVLVPEALEFPVPVPTPDVEIAIPDVPDMANHIGGAISSWMDSDW
ncbi:hypothetical protein H6F96_00255 [Microcoleus sp. FACHB-53]|nr:hypothetical protein [Microcoleus sp. FACHB-53]